MNESIDEQQLQDRVRRLEARIVALESALAALTQSPGEVPQKMSLAQTLKLAILGTPAPVAPTPFSLPPAHADAPLVPPARPAASPVPVMTPVAASPGPAAAPPAGPFAAAPDMRPVFERLNMTDAFASLDLRVAEAAAAESSLTRVNISNEGLIEIDATLIDKAFARPPPEKLFVRAAIEELHPKITERVVKTWRTTELLLYLRKLIVDERGDRAGFAPAVMSELLLLSAILEAPEEKDAWAANARPV